MKTITNKFGRGVLYSAEDLEGVVYLECTACMSIYAEALSWANSVDEYYVTDAPDCADIIVVLSCQVTDLAVLNDLRTIERLREENYFAEFYIGGCLARRFDIELPSWVKRLDTIKKDHQFIEDKTLVHFAPPFWVDDFNENSDEYTQGHLFRDMYPLRIGSGCKNNCKYCTIRETRGEVSYLPISPSEFHRAEDILIVSDSPTPVQVIQVANTAKTFSKCISIRNVEPQVAVTAYPDIQDLAVKGLLKVFHSPIQSNIHTVLELMGRSSYQTMVYIHEIVPRLKELGVFVATNIIIDYGDNTPNPTVTEKDFDYISWNPYWDGNWDRAKAEERFYRYLKGGTK